MSLFGSLHIAGNAMQATQVGLQVVGQNIANANTPGYIREDVIYAPAPTQTIGALTLGLGVQIDGIVQSIDHLLEQRLRNATSDSASADVRQQVYQQLELLTNELNNGGLGKSLNDFVNSAHDLLNQPEDIAARDLMVRKGQALAADINRQTTSVDAMRADLDTQIRASVSDINRLTSRVQSLNVKIVQTEAGNSAKSTAVGLRDQRNMALEELSKLVDVNVQELANGSVAVYTGGDYLVFGNDARQIQVKETAAGAVLTFTDSGSKLNATGGKIMGLITARDQILGGFQVQLDDFAKNLIGEFNKLHSSGQGLSGYQSVSSQVDVAQVAQPLDLAGLAFTPSSGSFDVQIFDSSTGLTRTTTVRVDLDGLDQDTTLAGLTDQLNAIAGVSASLTPSGRLTIRSTGSDQQLAFGSDTSGVLAALGINTFFTGNNARNISVNRSVVDDPGKIATSRGGVGADAANAVALAGILDRPMSGKGITLSQLHDRILAHSAQDSAQASSLADGARVFAGSLKGQSLSISGVNIDEETIKLLTLQRTFQASAKFISTIHELLGVLIQL